MTNNNFKKNYKKYILRFLLSLKKILRYGEDDLWDVYVTAKWMYAHRSNNRNI